VTLLAVTNVELHHFGVEELDQVMAAFPLQAPVIRRRMHWAMAFARMKFVSRARGGRAKTEGNLWFRKLSVALEPESQVAGPVLTPRGLPSLTPRGVDSSLSLVVALVPVPVPAPLMHDDSHSDSIPAYFDLPRDLQVYEIPRRPSDQIYDL
jgi:hypothetical protein